MGFRSRLLLWIPALTYEGFLLSGEKSLDSLGLIATFGFLGASSGFLLASMFTIRQHRRDKLSSKR